MDSLNQFIKLLDFSYYDHDVNDSETKSNEKSLENENGILLPDSNQQCYIRILRIKNGFTDIKNWTKIEDFGYRDIKINVLISTLMKDKSDENSIDDHDGSELKQIIGEVQFLLSCFLDLKQMGHSLYSVIRRQEFADNVKQLIKISNDVYDHNYDYSKSNNENSKTSYHKKLKQMVLTRNMNEFENELLLNDFTIIPHTLISLNEINHQGWTKASKLLFSNIIHFDHCYSLGNKYTSKYLNMANSLTIEKFYGIDLNSLSNNKHDSKHSFISSILQCPQFNEITVKYRYQSIILCILVSYLCFVFFCFFFVSCCIFVCVIFKLIRMIT